MGSDSEVQVEMMIWSYLTELMGIGVEWSWAESTAKNVYATEVRFFNEVSMFLNLLVKVFSFIEWIYVFDNWIKNWDICLIELVFQVVEWALKCACDGLSSEKRN